MRLAIAALFALFALLTLSCGDNAPASRKSERKPAERVKIVQFYAAEPMIPKGTKGNLCYGVENAVRLDLDPPAGDVYPAVSRCIEISPGKSGRKTTYTLTAYGKDGSKETKSAEVTAGAAPPRLYDLWVNAIEVGRGEAVKVCFKVENAQRVKASPGTLDPATHCLSDNPSKTTTYKITAFGGDNQIDSGTVTVKVH
jgi:hypothetical protein